MIYTNHRIEFDPDRCVGCQMCYKACFVDVIRWDAENRKPVFKYVEDCEHCFCCMSVCRRDAIRVIPDHTSEHMMQHFDRYR
ncbi:MAG: 4Fe-4S binding protein [Lachnospiraceae bacterium]|nr:4Fe-4S binding protein [Lachnospiraceae bacterium]